MFWLIDSCQNSVSANQYRLTVSRAQVSTHRVRVFFEGIRWQVDTFQMIAGSSSIYLKCIWNKSCSWAVLLKCWFRTDFGRENLTGFYSTCREGNRFWLGSLRTRTRRSLKTPKPRRVRGENAVTRAGKTKLRMRTRRRQRQSCANPLNSAKHIFVL